MSSWGTGAESLEPGLMGTVALSDVLFTVPVEMSLKQTVPRERFRATRLHEVTWGRGGDREEG